MQKNLLFFLFAMALLPCKVFATSSTANATVSYLAPITVTEITPYSFKIARQSGVAPTTAVASMSTVNSAALNYFNNYPTATPGCFKITGAPSTVVNLQITLPASIGPITFLAGSNWPVGFISTTGCVTTGLSNKGFYGLTTTLDATGVTYISWGISQSLGSQQITVFDAAIGLANLSNATYTATTTITVNY